MAESNDNFDNFEDFNNIIDDENFVKIIGKNMRYHRELAGLSQEEVAHRANISTSYYQKLETMQAKNPGIRSISRICCALDIPLDFVLRDTNLRAFQTYANTVMFKEMSKFTDYEFKMFTKTLETQYELFKNRELALKESQENN